MPREFPEAFKRRLHSLFPDFVDGRWNEQVSRWEFVFLSPAGFPSSQFYGWDRNPLTGTPIPPDPATGLYPFRDLTPDAQDEIVQCAQATFIGNAPGATGDARHDRLAEFRAAREHNQQLVAKTRKQRSQDWADAVSEFDIRRPGWLKEHSREGQFLLRRQRQRLS